MAPPADVKPVMGESPASQRSHSSSSSLTPPQLPQTNTAASADHKTIRKRNRVPLSCNFCRQRKLKCNRGHPCENCIKRGEEASCVYLNVPHTATHVASQQGLSPQIFANGALSGSKRATGVELQNRLDKLESLVLGLMHSSSGDSDSPQDSNGDESNNQMPDFKPTNELAPDVDAVGESLGMMKLDKKGKAMYHGETHWGALLNELSEVKALFERGREYHESMDLPQPNNPENGPEYQNCFPFNSIGGVELSDILALIPSRPDCDVLVYRYFEVFDPIYHVLHKPTFENEYASFWRHPEKADIVWIGMLLCILTIALQSFRLGGAPSSYLGRESDTWLGWQKAAEVCLVEGNFMLKGSIMIIRTLTLWLMSETRTTLNGNWMDRTWVSVGMIIRIAQSMGLHRDPKWFNISPYESEIRRQMWCVVTSLDILFSVNEGLPLTIRAGEHDVRLPVNVDDVDFCPDSAKIPDARPWEVETNTSYLLCQTKMANVLCRIVSGTFSLRPRPGYDTILAHDAELRATFASYPEYLRVPPEASNPLDPPHIIMQRFLLDLQYRKSLIVLHRPFAARAQASPKFKRSKEECMDASLQILRRQNWLYHSPAARETLDTFAWFTDGLMLNHFFHACIMLCVELYTNMDSLSLFQRQTVRDSVDVSRQIHASVGRFDMSAAKKHGLIESLLERFYEVEKMTPEERKAVQKNALRGQPSYSMDLPPGTLEPTVNADMSSASYDSHGHETLGNETILPPPTIVNGGGLGSLEQGPTSMQVDAQSFGIMFLPEEDEIYMDAPFRLRPLPDPNWMQHGYTVPQPQENGSPLSSTKQSIHPNGALLMNGLSGNGDQGASGEEQTEGTSTSIGSGSRHGSMELLSPSDNRLSSAGMMMMTYSPGNDVPQGMNWEEWDMFMHGVVDLNPATWSALGGHALVPGVDGATNGASVFPGLGWDSNLHTGLTPEPSLMDTADGMDERTSQSQPTVVPAIAASPAARNSNGTSFNHGRSNF
ncbi:fungal-specific transcription factor domain-containing protein [Lipomyces kononenkoae]|uniref:Fungal-specific transcription factor domain-containing protein n=1 Tax=Lipomyces kononenkoae TaxID=34357 RepID=A0ACC3TBB5_LIPKO